MIGDKHSENGSKMLALLLVISAVTLTAVWFFPPIPQDPAYHNFADQRSFLGIANMFNVLSNAFLFYVGIAGIRHIVRNPETGIVPELYPAYLLFFIGVFLVGVGSSYYHLAPSNQTLIWDRLPMTIAFMAFFAIILAEFVSVKAGKVLFIPLLMIGLFSIWYWSFTEQQGVGDLRLYGVVQFLPMLLIPLILITFPARFSHVRLYWLFFGFYLLAKIFELFDQQLYQMLSGISGHPIKHLLASFGCYSFLYLIKVRKDQQEELTETISSEIPG